MSLFFFPPKSHDKAKRSIHFTNDKGHSFRDEKFCQIWRVWQTSVPIFSNFQSIKTTYLTN